jgi:hypothetical protein
MSEEAHNFAITNILNLIADVSNPEEFLSNQECESSAKMGHFGACSRFAELLLSLDW